MVERRSVCEWMFIQHARHLKLPEQRNTFLKLLPSFGRSQITTSLRIPGTKLDGEMGSTPGSYLRDLRFKTSASTQTIAAQQNTSEAGLTSLFPRPSNYTETASLNKPLKVRCSYILVASDGVHIRRWTGVFRRNILPTFSWLNVL